MEFITQHTGGWDRKILSSRSPSLHSKALYQALKELEKEEEGEFVVVVFVFRDSLSSCDVSWTQILLPLPPKGQGKFWMECNTLLWSAAASFPVVILI